jgi:hypothetical protein
MWERDTKDYFDQVGGYMKIDHYYLKKLLEAFEAGSRPDFRYPRTSGRWIWITMAAEQRAFGITITRLPGEYAAFQPQLVGWEPAHRGH